MLISRETDYAVRTVLYLAQKGDHTTNVTEVSHAMHIPKSFLAKILQRLRKKNMLVSVRGVNGGFKLAKKPSEISLFDIMESMQGPTTINLCVNDSKKCRLSSTCPVHPVWMEIRQEVEKRLQKQTVAALM